MTIHGYYALKTRFDRLHHVAANDICIAKTNHLGIGAARADVEPPAFVERTGVSSPSTPPIRVLSATNAPRRTLGELRNIATRAAVGDWISQWDDDDRYHPERLALQWQAMQSQGAAFCFLVDQLHWFDATSELFWEDWQSEAYPLNFVKGSMLARRDLLPDYPALTRGEDTPACWQIACGAEDGDYKIARLRGAGWSYVYRHHGCNAWDEAHHRAISTARSMSPARLQAQLYLLQARLAEYRPALTALNMQVGSMVAGFKGGQ